MQRNYVRIKEILSYKGTPLPELTVEEALNALVEIYQLWEKMQVQAKLNRILYFVSCKE